MQQYDASLEELSKKIPSYLMAIDAILPDESKVLFVKQTSLPLLKRLKERKFDVSILDRNIANSAIYQKYNIVSYTGDPYSQITKFSRESFDYVIFDNSLTTFADIQAIITASAVASEHIVVILDNAGYWKKRLNFLISGSFSGESGTEWYTTKHLRMSGIKDFMAFCSNVELIIERACYFDSKGLIHNLYDLKRLPGIFGEKLLFIMGHRSNYISLPLANEI